MKLKQIMYALAYGQCEKQLKRKEGARRVKQAYIIMHRHITDKAIMFPFRYGGSSKNITFVNDKRKQDLCKNYEIIYGSKQEDMLQMTVPKVRGSINAGGMSFNISHSVDSNNNSIDNLIWCDHN